MSEYMDTGGQEYPSVMEDGTVCMERVHHFGDSAVIHQRYDDLQAAVYREVHYRVDSAGSILPGTAMNASLVLGRAPMPPGSDTYDRPKPFVDYDYFDEAEDVGVAETIYNPYPAGNRDEPICSIFFRPGAPTQVVLYPSPRGGNMEPPAYATIDEAIADLTGIMDKLLEAPDVFERMERLQNLGEYRYRALARHERLPEAKERAGAYVRMLLMAAYPNDQAKQQRGYILAKGLSVIDMYADTLLMDLISHRNEEDSALGNALPYDTQLTHVATTLVRRLNHLDASFAQPIMFCDLDESGVAYAARSSDDMPSTEADDYEPFNASQLHKTPAPYNAVIAPDGADYAYRFEPADNGVLIVRLAASDNGYREVYQLWVGNCDPHAIAMLGDNPRANFARIPRELAVVAFRMNGQDVTSTSLASAA